MNRPTNNKEYNEWLASQKLAGFDLATECEHCGADLTSKDVHCYDDIVWVCYDCFMDLESED